MKIEAIIMLLAGVYLSGCGQDNASPPPAATNASSSGNPLLAPVDYLGAAAKAQKSAGKVTTSAGLNQAIKMFEAQNGRFPKTLNELVPDVINRLPAPPAGMKYDYNPADGTLRVVPQ
jgi:hypothetical protein